MPPGHLFILRGDIFSLQCTVRVVSAEGGPHLNPGPVWRTGLEGSVEEPWLEDPGTRFRLWSRGAHEGQATPDTWVIDVTDISRQGVDPIVQRVKSLIRAIADDHATRRLHAPLSIGLPFLGTGGAGGKSLRADLLRNYLEALQAMAKETGASIALSFFQNPLFPRASENGARAYAMAQAIRRKNADRYWPQQEWPDLLPRLGKFAAEGRLAVFVGAGVSRAAGLPGWGELLRGLRDRCERENRQIGKTEDADLLPSWEELCTLDPLLCGQVIQEWWPKDSPEAKQSAMRRAIAELVGGQRYGLQHALLAALPVQDFVTTNYDQLLEFAANEHAQPLSVVPAANTERWNSKGRRLLKLHGTVGAPEGAAPNLVLTAQDYLRFHETSGALGGAVQGLMLSHHLLFVGFSMTDPNFLRLHDSVARLLPPSTDPSSDPIGTALLVESQPWRIVFANRMLRGIHCTRPARSSARSVADEARWLEIFLDALVATCSISAAYVSDNLFNGLLDERDVTLANALLQLPAEADTPLHEKLRTLLRETGLRKG